MWFSSLCQSNNRVYVAPEATRSLPQKKIDEFLSNNKFYIYKDDIELKINNRINPNQYDDFFETVQKLFSIIKNSNSKCEMMNECEKLFIIQVVLQLNLENINIFMQPNIELFINQEIWPVDNHIYFPTFKFIAILMYRGLDANNNDVCNKNILELIYKRVSEQKDFEDISKLNKNINEGIENYNKFKIKFTGMKSKIDNDANDDDAKDWFTCPISSQYLMDILNDTSTFYYTPHGRLYTSEIKEWIKKNPIDPFTREPLTEFDLINVTDDIKTLFPSK
mgnify:CR=1 FL=1